MTSAIEQAASLLANARRTGQPIRTLAPELVPADRDAAYRIQDAVIERLGPVGAWKVAAGTGFPPLCAPLPATDVLESGADIDVAHRLVTLVEVEVGVVIGHDLPPRDLPYTADEVRGAIAGLAPALEIVGTRFAADAGQSPLADIADLQKSAAVVIGQSLIDWQDLGLASLPITLTLGGKQVGSTNKGPDTDAVLETLAWLANKAAPRHGGLKAGQVVITGSRLLDRTVVVGDAIEGRIEGLGTVTARYV